MFVFKVHDMRVSGQAAAVMAAVRHVDENASVVIDLPQNEVRISPVTAGATALSDAIAHAGFNPVLGDRGVRVSGQPPPKIPFDGADHDFTASSSTAARPPYLAAASDPATYSSP